MKIVPLYLAAAITVVAMLMGVSIGSFWSDARATSEESHLVLNYIQANNLPALLENRFHAINSDWPPSRKDLASLLLDAQVVVAQRRASKKEGA